MRNVVESEWMCKAAPMVTQSSSGCSPTTDQQLATASPVNRGVVPAVRMVSIQERECWWIQNLCLNCDEKVHLGHHCKRLFWLEVDGLDVTDNKITENEPGSAIDRVGEAEISLHSMLVGEDDEGKRFY